MVLDQAVMNVAISQLVEDFDTTVTTIQIVIALYALVMAGLMLIGGKLGDLFGRRRTFVIGLCIYGGRLGAHRRLLERALADVRLVDPRGDRGGAGDAGDGRARRLQLPRPGPRAGLRGPRRRRRRRDRRRADPRRLGDDGAELAGRLRRRGRGRDRHPARQPPAGRAEAGRRRPRARLGRRRPLRDRARGDGPRRDPGEQLGLAGAAQLPGRALRPGADAVRDRRRRHGPRRASPPGSGVASGAGRSRSSTWRCSRSRPCAAGWRCCSPRTWS